MLATPWGFLCPRTDCCQPGCAAGYDLTPQRPWAATTGRRTLCPRYRAAPCPRIAVPCRAPPPATRRHAHAAPPSHVTPCPPRDTVSAMPTPRRHAHAAPCPPRDTLPRHAVRRDAVPRHVLPPLCPCRARASRHVLHRRARVAAPFLAVPACRSGRTTPCRPRGAMSRRAAEPRPPRARRAAPCHCPHRDAVPRHACHAEPRRASPWTLRRAVFRMPLSVVARSTRHPARRAMPRAIARLRRPAGHATPCAPSWARRRQTALGSAMPRCTPSPSWLHGLHAPSRIAAATSLCPGTAVPMISAHASPFLCGHVMTRIAMR
jgi:hypothetical protein